MKSWGYHCDVIAPSLIPKKPGDKRKNDFRDARKLAKNYCNGDLTIVHPPTEQEEAVRGIIRCRISFKDNSKRCKQQINSLLMTQDVRWTERSKLTVKHLNWLRKLELPERYLQQTLMEHLELLEYLETRIKYLDTEIDKISESEQ